MTNKMVVVRFLLLFILFLSVFTVSAQGNDDATPPNVFTPNGDNINDVFLFEGLNGEWTMRVFDRWGVLVFVTDQAETEG